MPDRFEFDTARLRLRRLGTQHLEDLLALDSDPEVMRFINGGVPSTREAYERELLPRMVRYEDEPFGFLAAYEKDEVRGEPFVGWFHLRPSVADPTVLELGYRLRREAWGRGLATEGALALVAYAFDELDQHEVDACADPQNLASKRVMEKCGMRPGGTFRHPLIDLVVERYVVRRP